jgi:hypothetical protein
VRFTLDGAAGDSLCFDGQLAAQVTHVPPRGDSLLIARMFATAGRQWVFQVVCRTWDRGEVSWDAAWPHATRDDAHRDVARRLAAHPFVARVLFERLGWQHPPATEPAAATHTTDCQSP